MMIKKFEDLKGLTLQSVEVLDQETEMVLTTTEGIKVRLYHSQDCCESVSLEDIEGDIADLINAPVLMAEESENSGEEDYGTYTWTFYRFQTTKGFGVIR